MHSLHKNKINPKCFWILITALGQTQVILLYFIPCATCGRNHNLSDIKQPVHSTVFLITESHPHCNSSLIIKDTIIATPTCSQNKKLYSIYISAPAMKKQTEIRLHLKIFVWSRPYSCSTDIALSYSFCEAKDQKSMNIYISK